MLSYMTNLYIIAGAAMVPPAHLGSRRLAVKVHIGSVGFVGFAGHDHHRHHVAVARKLLPQLVACCAGGDASQEDT